MLKAKAEAVVRTGLSAVQARTNVVKQKRGDQRRTGRKPDFNPAGTGVDEFGQREKSEGPRTAGNKQFIKGTGSRSGRGGGTGKIYQYKERGRYRPPSRSGEKGSGSSNK